MAKVSYEMGDMLSRVEAMGSRENLRKILEAGTKKCIDQMKMRTQARHHIVTGEMMNSIQGGRIYEDLNSIYQYVYPQGRDSRGSDNAVKAFVINYGAGGHKTAKTGDKFITGKHKQLQDEVSGAMQAEADRIKNDLMR